MPCRIAAHHGSSDMAVPPARSLRSPPPAVHHCSLRSTTLTGGSRGRMTGVCCWLGLTLVAAGMAQTYFHTPPDQSKEPRSFHRSLETSPDSLVYRSKPVISHVPRLLHAGPRVPSPNKAYWFSVSPAGCPGAGTIPARRIDVFTERPAMLRLALRDADLCASGGAPGWFGSARRRRVRKDSRPRTRPRWLHGCPAVEGGRELMRNRPPDPLGTDPQRPHRPLQTERAGHPRRPARPFPFSLR